MAYACGETCSGWYRTTYLLEHYSAGVTAETFLSVAEPLQTMAKAMIRSAMGPLPVEGLKIGQHGEASACLFPTALLSSPGGTIRISKPEIPVDGR